MIAKKLTMFAICALVLASLTACNPSKYEESDQKIISAKSLSSYIGKENVAIVDMQSAEDYAAGHVAGAVNLSKDDIVINVPVDNMLTSKSKIEKLMSASGIGNDTTVIAYDSNKMNAPRFFWTMLMYGNENVKVVDGGIEAIKAAGVSLTAEVPTIAPATYTAGEKQTQWLATAKDVMAQVNEPDPNVVLLDVRTDKEFAEKGKVPSSVMYDYINNFYKDSTFKSAETTRIDYINLNMRPEKEIIMYCQTSMRAAPVFLRLYDAGYRNIKLYDGAYLEWSSNPSNPVDLPAGQVAAGKKDAS